MLIVAPPALPLMLSRGLAMGFCACASPRPQISAKKRVMIFFICFSFRFILKVEFFAKPVPGIQESPPDFNVN